MMDQFKELRRYPRAGVKILADYISPLRMTFDYVTDLSLGGAFINSDAFDPVGTPVSLWVMVPVRPGLLELGAEVVWTRTPDQESDIILDPGMGLRFHHLPGPVRTTLSEYLRSL